MNTLLVTDLDGTILGPDGRVPLTSLGRLAEVVRDLDLVLCVATSRSVHNVRSLPLKPDWLVAHDGACVLHYTDGRFHSLAEILLDPPKADALLDIAFELSTVADGTLLASVFYGTQVDYAVDAWAPDNLCSSVRTSFAELVNDGRQLNWVPRHGTSQTLMAGGARAVSLFGSSSSVAEARKAMPPLAGVSLHEYPETRGGPGMAWLDAQAPGVDKGLAVTAICEKAGFDHVLALGNGKNDVGMLAAASLAVAPADASPEAQAIATMVFDQRSDGGAFTDAIAHRLPELVATSVEVR